MFLICSFYNHAQAQTSNTIKDSKALFELKIPPDWNTTYAKVDSSFLKLTSEAPKRDIYVELYSGDIKNGYIDLIKLVDSGRSYFPFLGYEIERNKIGGNRYEVFYDNKNQFSEFSKAIFVAKENHYYVLLSYSKLKDFAKTNAIIDSFQTKVPFSVFSIIYMIGTASLLLHVFLFIGFFTIIPILFVGIDDITKLFSNAHFLWKIPLSLLLVWLLFYLMGLTKAYQKFGEEGLYYQLLYLGPDFFDQAGEFISEMMSEVIGFGFWPGGLIGVILSTIVSVALNCAELYFVINTLQDRIAERSKVMRQEAEVRVRRA